MPLHNFFHFQFSRYDLVSYHGSIESVSEPQPSPFKWTFNCTVDVIKASWCSHEQSYFQRLKLKVI